MANVGAIIETLETFRDREMWKEGFMVWDDHRETRISICNSAIHTIREQQAEIERLKGLKTTDGIPIPPKYGSKSYVCPRCSLVLDEARDDYCPSCGTRMDWSEIESYG